MTSKFIIPNISEFPQFLKSIERKWGGKLTRRFERERFMMDKESKAGQTKPPRYILSMFPYPSGRLHLGHVRIYTSGDILSRYSKLMCKHKHLETDYENVINPMGFDSFGLPAENAAKERNLHPATWTNSNIRTMKKQLDDLGLQFNWREATSNPSFYKWTQDIFLKLMDAGLVYKSFAPVNWDPIDKTVLADEQVDDSGRSWRSGALVEKRFFRQWFIKVNAFIDDIYKAEGINLETWQDILTIQRNWMGKPEGWMFYLPVKSKKLITDDLLPVYTQNPELFISKDARLAISSDHWLNIILGVTELENPFTGEYLEVTPIDDNEALPPNSRATLITDRNPNDQTNGFDRERVLLQSKLSKLGGYFTSNRYRDWLVSRQRFWGTPIPVIRCSDCGYQGVPRDQLPVLLPNVPHLDQRENSQDEPDKDELRVVAPIEKLASPDWLTTDCPSCGSRARRECETFDTLFDSSWYFLRYASEPTIDKPFDKKQARPVWCYIGGKEHASMHLFYARFITYFLHSVGELNFQEPFKNLMVQGVVKSRTFKYQGKYITNNEADKIVNKKELSVEYEKMSKSKGNGVDPQELIDTYGIDATRFCLMSYANPKSERLWRSHKEEFKDVNNYLRRVALTVQEYHDLSLKMHDNNNKSKIAIVELSKDELRSRKSALIDSRNKCSIDAIFNIEETYQLRQYIAALYGLTNTIRSNITNTSVYSLEFAESLASLLVMLNPIVPHLTEELWSIFSLSKINPLRMNSSSSYDMSLQVSDQAWPLPDRNYGRSQCCRTTINS